MIDVYPMKNNRVLGLLSFEDGKEAIRFVKKTMKTDYTLGGEEEDVEFSPRFNTLKEIGPHMFSLEKEEDGTYAIRNVPLFKTHGDTRKIGHISDRAFLDRLVKNFYATKKATRELFGDDSYSWLPKWHYGHTTRDHDLPERQNAGLIDNIFRVEDFLFGDIIGLNRKEMKKLLEGKYPDRSAEIDIKRARLLSVAALGFRTPHFGLPQMSPRVLRKKYQEMVLKNDVENVAYHIYVEDLPMPVTKKGVNRIKFNLSPEEVARFFVNLEYNEEMKEKFESLKDEAIQEHCDTYGSMPVGSDIASIIQRIIQQMMEANVSQKINKPSMYASDVIDFESDSHHSAGEQDIGESKTKVSGPSSDGLQKGKRSGDSGVNEDGTPSESENEGGDDDDMVDGHGDVVSKNILQVERNINSLLEEVPDSVRNPLRNGFKEVTSSLRSMSSLIMKQKNALDKSNERFEKERYARRKENIYNRLKAMFDSKNPNVMNQSSLNNHLDFAMDLTEEKAEQYLKNLEIALPLDTPHTRKITRNQAVNEGDDGVLRNSYSEEEIRNLKKLGLGEDILKAAAIWDRLENN